MRLYWLLFIVGVLALSGCSTPDYAVSSLAHTKRAMKDPSNITPYPFNTCAVQINRPFPNGKPAHRRVYKGQEVLFCCTPCVRVFDLNPDPFMPRILAAVEAKEVSDE